MAELRQRTGVDSATPPARLADVLRFGLALAAGLVIGIVGFAFTLVFVPLGLATFAWRRAQLRKA